VARVLRLGAAGALLGTRFVASTESLAHEAYKLLLVESGADQSTLTLCFDLGWPNAAHRVLRNKTLDMWEAAGCPASGARPGEGDVLATMQGGRSLHRYESAPPLIGMTGSVTELCLYAGQGLDPITAIAPAAEIVRTLWQDCQAEMCDRP
jgi:NAD(P)H-dependent flavin oxidoreductase YrpB (nitropropane dioxygenase family)